MLNPIAGESACGTRPMFARSVAFVCACSRIVLAHISPDIVVASVRRGDSIG
jgi:hypothetical protein